MKRCLIVLLVCFFCCGSLADVRASAAAAAKVPEATVVFYVSPTGDDRGPGTINRPLATLEGARDAIRQSRKKGELPPGGATVLIRGGTYSLSKTFALNGRDSGSEQAPIVYRPYRNEKVHLTGGWPVTGFSAAKDPQIRSRLAPAARAKVVQVDLKALKIHDFGELKPRGFGKTGIVSALELFFDGKPMTLARWPNRGWAKIAAADGTPDGMRFTYQGDRPRKWLKADDLWLHGYWGWDWADTYEKVVSIDPKARAMVLRDPHEFGYKTGARYYALNLLEELDEPGEWYLDRDSGILYFWPPAPLTPASAYVSELPTIISLTNASYVTIKGMTIEYCRGTAVVVRGGNNNRIAGCTIRNAGNVALRLEEGSENGVQGSDIYNCGEGGIVMSGGDRKTLTPGGNYVVNNRIHDFGQWVRAYTPGIDLYGVGNRIAHNLIYNAPHTAILLHGNEQVVEYNEIHHVCLETSDAGAFYMGRDYSERGNIVRYNYFHDLGQGEVQAIYLDDFASGTMVYGNVVHKAGRCLQMGGGRDNTVENNVFVDCEKPSFIDARGTSWYKKYFDGTDRTLTERLKLVNYREPPYSVRYPKLRTLYDKNPALPEGNVFVRNIIVGGPSLELKGGVSTQHIKMESNLVVKDPGFVDRAGNDFRLKSDSPAFRLGFKQIPMRRIGLLRDESGK